MKYLTDEKRIKAVTVCFTDLEGRLHMLDYDKKFLLEVGRQPDLRRLVDPRLLARRPSPTCAWRIDWPAFYWLPVRRLRPRQGAGVRRGARARRHALRRRHARAAEGATPTSCSSKDGTVCHAANEIEGFLFKGRDAERHYHETGKFEFISTGGYYHSLPGDALRQFIDTRGRGAARDGLREREGPPRGGALAVRDELLLHRGRRSPPTRCSSTSCSAARWRRSMDMTASLPAQAGDRRQRQRHAHQPVARAQGQEPVLRREGPGRPVEARAGTSSTASSPAATTSA